MAQEGGVRQQQLEEEEQHPGVPVDKGGRGGAAEEDELGGACGGGACGGGLMTKWGWELPTGNQPQEGRAASSWEWQLHGHGRFMGTTMIVVTHDALD